ncbi:hypothetical protein OCU04_008076 [Sclerotinia nivalis]|uniref:PKS/mFAS DH domain-containing protein n=1 Tax=Sclerotinia nivalis TaxID=352851 RepID=A0A9X0AKX0_9HELO|nr:hypothetical protein OCU04_008076 [Sclerotinia nivalis]
MVSPVCFNKALIEMLSEEKGPNYLIEIGPSEALAGPISQNLKSLPNGDSITYSPSSARGQNAGKAIFDLAGCLFVAGHDISLRNANQYAETKTIVDLPNYTGIIQSSTGMKTHRVDWRFKRFVNHDLLGAKVIGTTWKSLTWRKLLNLSDVPWLKDHNMGSDVLMPGAGYIAMAVEGLYQKTRATTTEDRIINSPNELCCRFRNIRFAKALVPEDDKESAVLLSLTQQHGGKDWREFRISSTTGDLLIEHCSGLIRLQDPVDEHLTESDNKTLQHSTSGKVWYKSQVEAGYGFGPSFQRLLKVKPNSGQRQSRVQISLAEPSSKWSPQSYYPIHPASLDGCFQTVTPALWAGERSSVNAVLVPAIIDDLIINSVPSGLQKGLSLATSEYSGRGRLEEAKSYFANCSVYDPENGVLLMQIAGLRFAKLDMGVKTDPHVFDCISWKPGITFFSQEKLISMNPENSEIQLDVVIDLVAHKKPGLRILEVNLNPTEIMSVWFEPGDLPSRSAYLQYDFASDNAKDLVSIQSKYKTNSNTSFFLLNTTKEASVLPSHATYDLVILKISKTSVIDQSVPSDGDSPAWSLYTNEVEIRVKSHPRNLSVVRLSENTPSLDSSLKAALGLSGWKITDVTYSSNIVAETGTVVLVLDELYAPVLTHINATQWEGLEALISSGNHLLWVTKGAQDKVTNPNNALVQGLLCVGRREDPSAKLSILYPESSTGPATDYAIDTVLKSLESSPPDMRSSVEIEFVERNGTLFVQRVIPDLPANEFKRAEIEGTFQGLTWRETAVGEVPVDSENIEIEVMAVVANFKDAAVTMGMVPENKYNTGYEGAGVVKRLGPGVIKFKVGDRVCFFCIVSSSEFRRL